MTLTLLFDHFDRLITRAGDIPRLNELILQLAVQGRLVAQNPANEPASALLARIKAEKARLVKEKKIRRPKKLPPISDEEIPFDLPEGWTWVRLGKIVALKSGTSLNKSLELPKGDLVYIKVGDMNLEGNEYEITTSSQFVNRKGKIVEKTIPARSIVFPKRGGAIATNKKRIVRLEILADSNLMAITCPRNLLLEYLYQWFNSIDLWMLNSGTSVPQINNKDIAPILFPLPPLAEQRRIVERVETLLDKTRALESELAAAEAERAALTRASLHHLTAAPTLAALSEQWQELAPTFDALLADPAAVDELKQAILQLAVQGRLVPQSPADEPASMLLERIKAEKARLVKEGKIRKSKKLPPISCEEIPFDLPEGWVWVRLGNLCETITKGSSPKWQGVEYVDKNTGILFLTSKNVGRYDLITEELTYVETKFNDIEPRSILKKNDFLMNIVGASIGRTAIFSFDEIANINQAVCLIRLVNYQDLVADYFLHFFNSSVCIGYMFDKQVDNARANLSMGNIAQFLVPLPPLAEQRRIVERVEQLLALCDDLQAQLEAGETARQRLLASLLHNAANGPFPGRAPDPNKIKKNP